MRIRMHLLEIVAIVPGSYGMMSAFGLLKQIWYGPSMGLKGILIGAFISGFSIGCAWLLVEFAQAPMRDD